MKRALIFVAVAVPILLIAGWLGLRTYLHSNRVATQVISQLAEASGERVAIDDVDIGITRSTLHGVHFFEPDGSSQVPWLTIDSLTIHAPVWQLDRGELAHAAVHADGVHVLLRFNSAGSMVTKLPAQKTSTSFQLDRIPELTIENSEVTLSKEDHGKIIANKLSANVTKANGELVLDGTAETQNGPLTIHGTLNASHLVNLKLSTRRAHVTQDFLQRLPWVPVAVFRELQFPQGEADAVLDVKYDLERDDLHYGLEIDARNAEMYIPVLALAVHDGDGKVVVTDDTARVPEFRGKAIGGTVHTQGTLVYQTTGTRIILQELNAADVRAEDVPATWGIPAPLRKSIANGRLYFNGTLDLTVREPDTLAIAATGLVGSCNMNAGWSEPLALAAIPQDPLTIESHGKGQIRDPQGKQAPMDFNWEFAPAAHQEPDATDKTATLPPVDPRGTFVSLVTIEMQDEKAKTTPKYFDFTFNLKNASLAELIKNEDLKLPIPVDGKLSVHVKASLPLDRLSDLGVYKASGNAKIEQFRMGGLSLSEVKSDFHLADGSLYLDSLKSELGDADKKIGGPLTGSGRVQLSPLGPLHADLHFEKISLPNLVQQKTAQIQGTVSGSITIDADASKMKSARDVHAEGKITGDHVAVYGVALDDLAASFLVKDGGIDFPELRTRVDGVLLKPTASVTLGADGGFQGKLTVRDLDVDSLRAIAQARKISLPPLAGTLTLEAVADGKGDEAETSIAGTITSPQLSIDKLQAHDVLARWKLEKSAINVTEAKASVYEGKVAGSANIPTDGKSPTKVDLAVEGVNVKPVAAKLGMPISIEGKVGGSLHGTIVPAKDKEPAKADFDVDIKSTRMRLQSIPAEQVVGKLTYKQGELDYSLTGKSLGGTFDVEGKVPSEAKQPEEKKKEKPKQESRLRVRNVEVGRLLSALGARSERRLSGTVNIDVRYTHNTSSRFPRGSGTIRVSGVQWSNGVIADEIEGDVILNDEQIGIRNLEGVLADGTIAGQLSYYFRERERSWFTLRLDSVESGRLLAPWFDGKVQGPIQARVRGRLGSTWSGSADVTFVRGKASGLEIGDFRIPATWSYSPDQNRGQIEIAETTGHIARGNARGKLTASWDNGARVDGYLRLDRVELTEFLRETVGKSDVAAGRTTAVLTIKGSQVRSLKDLDGKLVASFQQSQTLQLPVLSQITPFLGIGPSTTFQKGNLIAHLSRGTLRIEQMALTGSNVQVFVDGSVTLEERLNLHVVAKTGNVGWPAVRLGPISLRLPLVGPVPLVVAEEVTQLISNRVVYLDVTGTAHSPVIRPRPLPILSSAAVRFFLDRANLPVTLNQ